MPFEPVILFFLLGLCAGLIRSDLKIPGVLYESLSIFLLLAIGLKGGVELARYPLMELALPGLIVVLVATLIPLTAFPLLHRVGRLPRADAASIAAHYGSVSVVTFAVASSFLAARGVSAEGYMVVFLVLLEFPALMIGVAIARRGSASAKWGPLLHEVFSGKSIVLLLGGLIIGWVAGADGIKPLDRLFFDLFKGMLALFLLEMGLVAAGRLADLRRAGPFLLAFATVMPLCAGLLGVVTANFLDLSVGGAVLLATLYASASYIAAPAAMRIAVPEANPAISIGAALGITFPFNLLVGIPAYHWLAIRLQGVI
ncbi:MAG: sodium-dependent bicarbonate transport family permease [Rhodocyclaceae bacterium]|nr:sodium-dependent bicarbonate transport family permease [Rhodocyclaceae bacterium]MCP5231410.1 sodium-dependent bicarbonate transport family permease [Zoogloeaceae bacterium]MCB1911702.1 sodium-dependent bicarbonate transport family permease [Rhodocyclaceae bacterium]MCP5240891.1 sodium-dependent bicarbonate transport family permease [Zoogloeaceae bacterium]MCP5255331.1 sodium-dependent bicarbonate transport family permease [Zoogloeaceae bacterium]